MSHRGIKRNEPSAPHSHVLVPGDGEIEAPRACTGCFFLGSGAEFPSIRKPRPRLAENSFGSDLDHAKTMRWVVPESQDWPINGGSLDVRLAPQRHPGCKGFCPEDDDAPRWHDASCKLTRIVSLSVEERPDLGMHIVLTCVLGSKSLTVG